MMNSKQLENLKEGSYIWLKFGRVRIGYIAKIVSVRDYPIKEIIIYSKERGYENLKNLRNIGYNIVLLDDLDYVSPKKLKGSCYIVLEFMYEKDLNRYKADVFHELRENNVLYLNGYEFHFNHLEHKVYQIPVFYH